MEKHKILIIKTGYSEILDDKANSREVSYGDVLRITPILHLYKNDLVTWLSDKKAFPLLEGSPYISRLMHYDSYTRDQLLAEEFDVMINLEKYPPLCAIANQVSAWSKHGFRLDRRTGEAETFDRKSKVLTVSADFQAKKDNKKPAQELLFEMVGEKWNGEGYILGYKPKTGIEFDIALNTKVGSKWPVKAWPNEKWDDLEKRLTADGFKVTRQDKQSQEVLSNLSSYMDWINSARAIITNDSLGLHLGLAFGKKVLGIFGPSSDKEFYFYGMGKAILPAKQFPCAPCFLSKCTQAEFCLDHIGPETVQTEIKKLLNENSGANQ